jgi:hypothetical protein
VGQSIPTIVTGAPAKNSQVSAYRAVTSAARSDGRHADAELVALRVGYVHVGLPNGWLTCVTYRADDTAAPTVMSAARLRRLGWVGGSRLGPGWLRGVIWTQAQDLRPRGLMDGPGGKRDRPVTPGTTPGSQREVGVVPVFGVR